MAQDNLSYLGQGLAYPFQIVNGSIAYASGLTLLQQSITIILNTPKGTKFFNPDFGCRIRDAVFEPNDPVLSKMLDFLIEEAIADNEPRVKYVSTVFESKPEQKLINCEITYVNVLTNKEDSFIYPLYYTLKY